MSQDNSNGKTALVAPKVEELTTLKEALEGTSTKPKNQRKAAEKKEASKPVEAQEEVKIESKPAEVNQEPVQEETGLQPMNLQGAKPIAIAIKSIKMGIILKGIKSQKEGIQYKIGDLYLQGRFFGTLDEDGVQLADGWDDSRFFDSRGLNLFVDKIIPQLSKDCCFADRLNAALAKAEQMSIAQKGDREAIEKWVNRG